MPTLNGPCARCRTWIRRYGEGATTLCADCKRALDEWKKEQRNVFRTDESHADSLR